MTALVIAAALSCAMPVTALRNAPPGMTALELRETATVLAFSEDGTRALIEEHVIGVDGGSVLRYIVLGGKGREAVVDASNVVGAMGIFQERIERDQCRAAAATLESALTGFRDVRVRASGCASLPPGRSIVEVMRTVPAPIADTKELADLTQQAGVPGVYVANNDGPLVVIISSEPGAIIGSHVVEVPFLRKDPRVNKRWADPR